MTFGKHFPKTILRAKLEFLRGVEGRNKFIYLSCCSTHPLEFYTNTVFNETGEVSFTNIVARVLHHHITLDTAMTGQL
jgi:hypothetical protein